MPAKAHTHLLLTSGWKHADLLRRTHAVYVLKYLQYNMT